MKKIVFLAMLFLITFSAFSQSIKVNTPAANTADKQTAGSNFKQYKVIAPICTSAVMQNGECLCTNTYCFYAFYHFLGPVPIIDSYGTTTNASDCNNLPILNINCGAMKSVEDQLKDYIIAHPNEGSVTEALKEKKK